MTRFCALSGWFYRSLFSVVQIIIALKFRENAEFKELLNIGGILHALYAFSDANKIGTKKDKADAQARQCTWNIECGFPGLPAYKAGKDAQDGGSNPHLPPVGIGIPFRAASGVADRTAVPASDQRRGENYAFSVISEKRFFSAFAAGPEYETGAQRHFHTAPSQHRHDMRAQRLKEFDAVVHDGRGYKDGKDEVSVFAIEDARVVGDIGKTAGFVCSFLGGVGIH